MKYDYLSKYYYKEPDIYEREYQERFDKAIKLNFDIGGNQAFYTEMVDIYKSLLDIQRINERIDHMTDKDHGLPVIAQAQYTNRTLIDEIVLTNDIEGVHSTRREINAILSDLEKQDKRNRFTGLVRKYAMLSKREPLVLNSCRDVRNLYDELFYDEIKTADPDDLPDGKLFRKDTVTVVDSRQKVIHRGLSPESLIIEAMDKALVIMNDESTESMIRTALFHYMFGYIHPFYEGNGRMSRLISSYMLTKTLNPLVAFKLSYVVKENLEQYYKAFKVCNDKRNRGDLTPFILTFTDIVRKACTEVYEDLQTRIETLISLKERITDYTNDAHMKDLYYILLQASLYSESGISIEELLNITNVTRPTLLKRLKEVKGNGLLIEEKQGKYKYYMLDIDGFLQPA